MSSDEEVAATGGIAAGIFGVDDATDNAWKEDMAERLDCFEHHNLNRRNSTQ